MDASHVPSKVAQDVERLLIRKCTVENKINTMRPSSPLRNFMDMFLEEN